ncbi:MAG: hypothetical protein K2G56_01390, partial [Eubacterium sp.]|nr:hypothetical protein [Eubacterium sp.]
NCNVSPQEMIDSKDIYKFDGAAVLDYYATTTYDDNTPTTYHFMIAYFEDENDETAHLASISMNKNRGEIFDKLFNYSGSEEIQHITFCATADSVTNLEKEIYDYYQETVEYCFETFDNVDDSALSLHYCFDDESQFEDYCTTEKEDFEFMIALSAIIAAVGIVFIVLGAVKRGPRKPSKKQLEAAREMLKKEEAYNMLSEEDDSYSYINSDDYFATPDYNYNDENKDK